ncbi:MAG: cytosine/adenosine deaminase-related metal-dependent hydrolase [Bacteroidia bacterium]|jgi:cytosine/adenosine deaminase-related metal-dependent hydrolase
MRFLSANIIFPISSAPVPNGILAIDDAGIIRNVFEPDDINAPDAGLVERFNGILCPGFVNAHCHLELSHMKDVVSEKTGLPKFVMEIVSKRNENSEQKTNRIIDSDAEMWANGIQAVGDICNTEDTLPTKQSSPIKYHSFVEVFSFDSSKADVVLTEGIRVAELYKSAGLLATVVPHAPYSVSEQLFNGIELQQAKFPGVISMHNQETASENEMFVSAAGELVELFKKFGEDFSDFHPDFSSSLEYSFSQLPKLQNVLLIHNTETTAEEMNWANAQRNDLFWCTCPSANLYIENRLPNLAMWIENESKICVGTDSLASNHQLSILEELKLIERFHPEIPLASLMVFATLNGATALGMHNNLGSFEKGKAPGVVLIANSDLKNMKFGNDSFAKRII